MLSLLLRGHVSTCPVPSSKCTCEWVLYLSTFLLVWCAASFETYIGLNYGMITLSDAAHAGADGLSDLVGIMVALPAVRFVTRDRGNKMIAVLLGLTVVGIISVTVHKMEAGYALSPQLIALAGGVAFVINALRAVMFYRSWVLDHNSTRVGLTIHASTDALHSAVVSVVGIVGMLAAYWVSLETLRYADGALSLLLCVYVGSMVPGVWSGHHNHKIFEWTLGRFAFFKRIMHHHSHHD